MRGIVEEHAFILFYMTLSLITSGFASFYIFYISSEANIELVKGVFSSTLYFIKRMPEGSSAVVFLPKVNNFNYSIIITGEKIIMESRIIRIEYNVTLNVMSTYRLLAGKKYLFKKINKLIIIYEVGN